MRQNATADPAGSNCVARSLQPNSLTPRTHGLLGRTSLYEKKSRFSTFPFGFPAFFSDFCVSGLDKYLAKVIFDSIIIKAAPAPKEFFMLRLSVICD